MPPRDPRPNRAVSKRRLKPEAERALTEAAERRRARSPVPARIEVGGRQGLEPVRYGDWEVKGLASDF